MKVGISSWTFPWAIGVKGYPPRHPLNGLGLLEKARTLGAQVVQIADNLQVDGSSVAALRKAASGMDLELGTRDVSPDNLLAYLEHAVALGARLVRALPCGPSDLFGAIRSVVGEFERQGVLLALENYEQLSVADLLGLIRRLDSPCVGICLDTVNSLGRLETPGCVIKMLAPFTVNLHVKDFDIVRVPHQMGFDVSGRPAGLGRLDLPSLLDEVRGHGRDPNLILEQWPPFSNSLEETIAREAAWAETGFDYVKRHAA